MNKKDIASEIEFVDNIMQSHFDDYGEETHRALQEAVKLIEQEQYYKDLAESYEKTINKLTKAIAEQEPKANILDKIRAEIESLSNANPSYWHTCDVVEREDVLDIIDKYKAESEG